MIDVNVNFRQNDPRWGYLWIGDSRATTIGRAGCLLTCLTMASNRLLGIERTPEISNALCNAAKAFNGAMMNLPKAAEALGVVANEAERIRGKIGDPRLAPLIKATLAKGGLAIVHVDHDSKLLEGDPEGDHFVLVTKVVPHPQAPHKSSFECVDPAPGAYRWLDAETCSGESRWSSITKTFKAVGVAPIWRKT